jgi:hypothetical protein
MKLFKLIDIAIQLGLMFTIIYSIIDRSGFSIITLIITLGVIQLISTAVHFALFTQLKHSIQRKIYHWLLLVAFSVAVFILIRSSDPEWDELEALANFTFFTLGMALYYFIVCVRELVLMNYSRT